MHFKFLSITLLLFLFTVPIYGQDSDLPEQGFALGVGFNQYEEPGSQVQGFGTYFRKLSDKLYALSTFDVTAVPDTGGEVLGRLPRMQFQFRPGLAIPFFEINDKLSVWGLGEVGLASASTVDGITTGGSFAGGGFALYRAKPNLGLIFAMRVIRNNVTGTQYVPEIGIAFGK